MSKQEPNHRVLIVDDQPEIHGDFDEMLGPDPAESYLADLARTFSGPDEQERFLPDFELFHAQSGEKAYDIVHQALEEGAPIAVAFVDIRMPPGIDGVETTRRLHELDPRLEVVLMTAYTDKSLPDILGRMMAPHKLLYIRKPFSREEVQQLTLSLTGKWNTQQALDCKRRLLEETHHNLKAVLDAAQDAMAMYNNEGSLTFANDAYKALFHMSEDELAKHSPAALLEHFETYAQEPDPPGRLLLEAPPRNPALPRRLYYELVSDVHDGRCIIGRLVVFRDVSRDLEIKRVKAEVADLRRQMGKSRALGGLIGQSPGMQALYGLLERVMENDVTVLIGGESGTGKELAARALHQGGPRHQKPFVAINCAAIPETLIENELFGHEQGAFTGAGKRHAGAFERAAGGTVFLDEIGDMPLALQAKLLRVLQEREIQSIGASRPIPIDIRLIAATNLDLKSAAEAGRFRSALYYRLAVFPVTMPPLRERQGDVALLAGHFLAKCLNDLKTSATAISGTALAALVTYDWPGNVRELENAIQRASLLEATDTLQAESLPPEIFHATDPSIGPKDLSFVAAERQAIDKALGLTAGNVPAAARLLGVSRATLYRKMSRHTLRR